MTEHVVVLSWVARADLSFFSGRISIRISSVSVTGWRFAVNTTIRIAPVHWFPQIHRARRPTRENVILSPIVTCTRVVSNNSCVFCRTFLGSMCIWSCDNGAGTHRAIGSSGPPPDLLSEVGACRHVRVLGEPDVEAAPRSRRSLVNFFCAAAKGSCSVKRGRCHSFCKTWGMYCSMSWVIFRQHWEICFLC